MSIYMGRYTTMRVSDHIVLVLVLVFGLQIEHSTFRNTGTE